MEEFLSDSPIVDFTDKKVALKAKELADGQNGVAAIAKACFLFVRDSIRHTGDFRDNVTTLKASEVLEQGTGWCYAKSHLLAALLRANKIPTALCYQRLSCSEYFENIYCLHGLNAVYLEDYGWYRIDARGNKLGINADFTPPIERLAFTLQDGESDVAGYFVEPLEEVVQALSKNNTYEKMMENLPDLRTKL